MEKKEIKINNNSDGSFYTWFSNGNFNKPLSYKVDRIFLACPTCFITNHDVLLGADKIQVTNKTTPHKKNGIAFGRGQEKQKYQCKVCDRYHINDFNPQIGEKKIGIESDTNINKDNLLLKKITQQSNKYGEITQTWFKFDIANNELKDIIKNVIGNNEVRPYINKIPKSQIDYSVKDNVVILPMFDAHIGVLSSLKETPYRITTRKTMVTLFTAFKEIVDEVNEANEFYFLNGGDWFHFDSEKQKTSSGHNQVKSDVTLQELFSLGTTLMYLMIEYLLSCKNKDGKYKFKKIIVRNIQGNHDKSMCYFLNFSLWLKYKSDKRIDITESAKHYYDYVFGDNLIVASHGKTIRHKDAVGWITTQFRDLLPKKNIYFFIGDKHHTNIVDKDGVTVLQQPVLGRPDDWANQFNFRSSSLINYYIVHKKYGKTWERTLSLSKIEDIIEKKGFKKEEQELMNIIDKMVGNDKNK